MSWPVRIGILPEAMAAAYVDAEKGVPDAEAALAGARDILAERFAEDQPARERLRKLFGREGLMRSKAVSGKEEDPDAAKYRDYFAWDEPAAQAPSPPHPRHVPGRRGRLPAPLPAPPQ